ncbi:MFS transporter [Actinocorallia sp. API 0066]|uniref:MFS transporter n=1 Tax=Actinocorallia sp. API 0066 TaxID=2896846 RepID=UPI001E2AD9F4|nr:MFS transporter [Actinocorallia sp. API 0066]MCD0450518.1 MFS transporter [Actinocorallia sp. API 0066]
MSDLKVTPVPAEPGVWSRAFFWVTLGSCALVFLAAFENIAVTTVMPAVSADLDGARWYALAFAGPLATGVIGMVAAGLWADRKGPVAPLYTSVALFAAGLLACGLATTMEALVAGRLAQGLGGGAITVALYVVVGQVFPEAHHPKIFALFAAAWVVPALVGPAIAGGITELLSWHWVFLGVVGLVAAAMLMVVPALRGVGAREDAAAASSHGPWLLVWAAVAALSVLALNLVGGVSGLGVALSLAAIAVMVVALRPLVPRGTLTARRGLPSVILLRGLAAGAFFSGDVYLPYLLTEEYGWGPALAGLSLTLGGLSWSTASAVQGQLGARLPHGRAVTSGTALILGSLAATFATAALGLHPAVAIIGWTVGGAGMGLMYPRLSTLALGLAAPAERGFTSSALTILDSLGAALCLAVAGLLFAGLSHGFGAVFGFVTAVGVAAVIVAPRVTRTREKSPVNELIEVNA